ncbi:MULTISPECIES: glucose-6-phosphate isomerase [unclassified Nitratiruptor]|uniref:glucose-6-phosphate isomerase n=1 Tax=unclassified Nitratiruptor TaxID=2624044 RepID=UPI001915E9D8|nr:MULTISPECIES: glucose-6-phosphate isomerase [unclassified Nitratiruptor]BCD60338.1 glucose-6-phosphate isomerase [Nitratiruptor sp. YY08-10]BCD64173.1 glucose-6-phosphate isomerase [Nitratiruptor sp. YY08-14]
MNAYHLDYPLEMDNEIKNLMANAYGAVLHEKENGVTGYFNLPQESMLIVEEIMKRELSQKFEAIAVIGIGGSSLGTKAVDHFLRYKKEHKPIFFLENPDPVAIRHQFEQIKKNKTLFIVISKSGGTIETLSIFKAAIAYFNIDLQKDTEQILVITDIDSPLHAFANEYGIESFAIPKNVGGRFSVMSAVGIVPLTIAGYDTQSFLEGARGMFDRFFMLHEEHILIKAAFIYKNWQKHRMNVLFSYADELEDFNKWYVQLWGESLGKKDRKGNRVGPTPIAHIGSVDQHSFLQLVMEGPQDKTLTFICIDDFEEELTIPDISLPHLSKTDFVNGSTFNRLINEECKATMQSVKAQNIPVDKIVLPFMNEESIGELMAYYELLTSVVGEMFGINTYNQPGVELGKKILKERFANK